MRYIGYIFKRRFYGISHIGTHGFEGFDYGDWRRWAYANGTKDGCRSGGRESIGAACAGSRYQFF